MERHAQPDANSESAFDYRLASITVERHICQRDARPIADQDHGGAPRYARDAFLTSSSHANGLQLVYSHLLNID